METQTDMADALTTRISVLLTEQERVGLAILANKQLRQPREQVRLLLRAELQRQGLLPADGPQEDGQ